MSIRPRSITSLTLARRGHLDYQITLWPDGVVRFDGREGPRQGAWEGTVDPSWFTRIAVLARDVESGKIAPPESPTTLVVETMEQRFVYEAGRTHEPASFWLLSTAIDGLAQRVYWAPLDVTGADDFARWATGVQVVMSVGTAMASGLAADGSIVVLAGSVASTATSPSLQENYKAMRSGLIDEGALTLEDECFRFTRHVHFGSSSAAASVLAGSNTNGRRAWRTSSGHPLSELDLD